MSMEISTYLWSSTPHVSLLQLKHTPTHFNHPLAGCGHCKRLAPAYEEVGEAFNDVEEVIVAKVDADADRTLGGRFGVRGFPTLKFFPKGSTTPEE